MAKTKKKLIRFKKLNFRKNWKKLSYFGLAAFLAVLSLGYGGYDYYKEESASAAGMTYIGSKSGTLVYACKYSGSSDSYKLLFTNRSAYPVRVSTEPYYGTTVNAYSSFTSRYKIYGGSAVFVNGAKAGGVGQQTSQC